MSAPLLLEIGCEEIPARMIGSAAADLRARVLAVLDQAGLAHGGAEAWGGTRRLTVRVEEVAASRAGRDETVLGPPASAAFGPDGKLTPAGAGFAKKQGVDPADLRKVETEKGSYAGFRRAVPGRSVESLLAETLPASIAAMTFPKMMRWADGTHRFVRPVHWVVALHGADALRLDVLGVRSGRASEGHRFLAPGPVEIPHADAYVETLRGAKVLVLPEERRRAVTEALERAASGVGGAPVEDDALLGEVVDLVEWPGVVAGRFDASFLDLPREILVTTLKHHQKSFSVQGPEGLLPAFLAVANTDRDPAGHVRRGNEWVVGGRLDDARFFWSEDRKRTLASRVADLSHVTFHKKLGSYNDKTQRIVDLAQKLSETLRLAPEDARAAADGATVCKADLVTGLVGEFPELQGVVGGLLLQAEGAESRVVDAVKEHYRPATADDGVPASASACIVALADRLDTIAGLIAAGESPTGSRDPFGLRRAAAGVFRIVVERGWPLSLDHLVRVAGSAATLESFLAERLQLFLVERGFTTNEVRAVLPVGAGTSAFDRALPDIVARLDAVRRVRGRADFEHLVDLTRRIHNIVPQVAERKLKWRDEGWSPRPARFEEYEDPEPAAEALKGGWIALHDEAERLSDARDYVAIIERIAALNAAVTRFFDDVLVLDEAQRDRTHHRAELLARLGGTLTRYFDIRELAGQAADKR